MKVTGKNILVTGGAGFIGSHLVDRIVIEQPQKLIVVDSLYLGKRSNLDTAKAYYPDLRFYEQDITEYSKMKSILEEEKIDVVFNLAVTPLPASLIQPYEMFMTNTKMAAIICELHRQGYFKTLVHFSSSEAYGTALRVPMSETHLMKPFTPYAASKAAGDHVANSYVETFHLDTVIVRPFNTYGPRQNEGTHAGVIPLVIQRILDGKPIKIFGSGEQTRDYTFVRDTAEAALRIYEADETRGKEINVCTGREVSINDLISTILITMGIPDYPIENTSERPGDVMRHLGDPSLLEKMVNFKPKTKFYEGMKETLEWYLFDSIMDVPEEIKERFRATNDTVNR